MHVSNESFVFFDIFNFLEKVSSKFLENIINQPFPLVFGIYFWHHSDFKNRKIQND